MPYQDAVQLLVDIGLVEVILPFILVFMITYGILQRTKILGTENNKPKKRLNSMVAFVMGFFAVLAANLLNVINIILFYFVLLLVIGLILALVLGLTGAEGGIKNRLFMAIMLIFVFLFVLFALVRLEVIDETRFFNTILWPVVVIAVIGLTLYFVLRGKQETRPQARREPQRPRPGAREGRRETPQQIAVTPEEIEEILRRRGEGGQTPPQS